MDIVLHRRRQVGGPHQDLGLEFLGDGNQGEDVVPVRMVLSVEGAEDAVADAAEGDFGEVVVPAPLFVGVFVEVVEGGAGGG
ncbi:hypothetical protein O988_09668 [Pseudogymnoascus sp. VKM F-3808]|nr:hypothetical protein O988_09668 [Pseudogymnoascus sp. VKM F-3808]